jgi:hypothetical protein
MGIQGEDWVDSGCVNKGVSSLLIFEQQIVDLLHVGLLDLHYTTASEPQQTSWSGKLLTPTESRSGISFADRQRRSL